MKLYNKKIKREIFASKIPVLVEFYAEWCGPCKEMKPIIEELKKELKGKAKFFVFNIEENLKLGNKFMVFNLPTFLIYRNGKIIKKLIGVQKREKLLSLLN